MFWKKKDVYVLHDKKKERQKRKLIPSEEQEQTDTIQELQELQELQETEPITESNEELEIEKKKLGKSSIRLDLYKFVRNKKKVGVLLIFTSLFVLLVASPVLNVVTSQEMTQAVVVTMEILKGNQITGDMVSTVDVPKSSLLPIHMEKTGAVIGQYAKSDMVVGELVTEVKISPSIPFDNAYLYELPEGKRVVSITLSAISASLSSKIMADDIVAIYTRSKSKEEEHTKAILFPELSYVKVLAVTNQQGYDLTSIPEKSPHENARIETALLLVDAAQAEVLLGLESVSPLHMALVHRGGGDRADFYLQLQDEKNNAQNKEK